MAIWDVRHETIDRERLEELQLRRLGDMLARIHERVPFYRSRLDEAGFQPGDLKSLGDLDRLPFTEKTDFRDNYPSGLFAVPMDEVVEIHSSSGTTGRPVVGGYTQADLATWAELVCRLAVAVGVHEGDVAQIAFGYGMFTGGFGLHYGLQRAGATVVPISAGNTARQLQFMRDFGTTVLIATPSYALYIGDVLQRRGMPLEDLRLRLGLFGAETCSEEMRARIEGRLPIRATDNYGLTELIGPGVAGECECRSGMHISEDHFLVECLDPTTSEPVADGEVGELVISALTRECSPVLRYRTRDLTTLTRERCDCGRTTARMGKVVGRTDDMFIISGVNIFPSAIESVLFAIEGVEPFYQIVLERSGSIDTFEVHVEVTDALFEGWMDDLRVFERRVTEELRSALLVRPTVKLVEPGTIERTEGKARRVLDHRPA
ncbi:MAG TPA: phenylacetate--CoA ligase [Thermoleophilia bacterium]|nr:phenylacetate--CoA ligase [Thermoleophilia bacterium]